MTSYNQAQIRGKLQQISASDLQYLAEEMACVKFPKRFNANVIQRQGRNDRGQTTKGWPDAFVRTGENEVDGVEATRQSNTWAKHLEEDFSKASDPGRPKLSGYFFIGGYPEKATARSDVEKWETRFASLGLKRSNVTILVGSDLVLELCAPRYAAILHRVLGIPLALKCLTLLGDRPLHDGHLSLFQPTSREFTDNLVDPPALIDRVSGHLIEDGCVRVRGYGAAGKTTLAELIARSVPFAKNAVLYADLLSFADGTAGADLLNEMALCADENVLFVIDNIHLDLGLAQQVYDHWKKHFKPLNSRLFLLGRKTERTDGWAGEALPSLELRAGFDEMKAVVRRLFAREGSPKPEIPDDALRAWAEIFGGTSDPATTAVDLIAFTAAVSQRIGSMIAGDFRLLATDAVGVIRDKYLRSLLDSGELKNIVRLSAMAEFEIPLGDADLPEPFRGLTHSIDRLGLVVRDHLGSDRRQCYRLVHAAIGSLLLNAAMQPEEVWAERLAAVKSTPALGPRITGIIRRNPRTVGHVNDFQRVTRLEMESTEWPNKARNLYELGVLVRFALRDMTVPPSTVDSLLCSSGALANLIDARPALHAVLQFLHLARQKKLQGSQSILQDALLTPAFTNSIMSMRSRDLASLVRVASNADAIFRRIDLDRWSKAQANLRPELASDTVAFCRLAENLGREDLARAPARRQVGQADPRLWYDHDLSHLSHLLRFAAEDEVNSKRLVAALSDSNWLSLTYEYGILGHTCGALLSFANYLQEPLWPQIATSELEARVERELSIPLNERLKHVSRPVCLLGGFTALGGRLRRPPAIDWSYSPDAALLFDDVAHGESSGTVGMYELQLWLGMKALQDIGIGSLSVPKARGESFSTRLRSTVPPSQQARLIKERLSHWLDHLSTRGWRLI